MSRTSHSFRHHKASNQGYVELNGRRIYLGKWGAPATEQAYHRTVAEWLSSGGCLPEVLGEGLFVAQLAERYWDHCLEYYRTPDGRPSGELSPVRCALRYILALYGDTFVVDFGPRALKAVRQDMVDGGCARTTINSQVGRLKRMFRWGVEAELVPPDIYHALQAVAGLKMGRSEAREKAPVRPAPREDIEAVRPLVSRPVRALVDLQLASAARPGELVILRPADIDTSGEVWLARPHRHKNSYRGHDRALFLGPQAQEVLRPFLLRPPEAYLFSPAEAEADRLAQRHEARKTPLSCGNRPGTNRRRRPKCGPGDHYTTGTYRRAIRRACVEAKVDVWTPHQLRHTVATEVRKEYGLEAAQVICGHRHANTTEIYAEANMTRAIEVQRLRG